MLQLDAAYATSEAFADNKYSDRRFNRSGIWGTLAVNANFKNPSNHTLSFIFLIKALRDNMLSDTTNDIFMKANSLDIGSKLEWNIGKFNLAFEYIKRNYQSDKQLNSERSVGIIQYKISDNLFVTGTYGKNFGNVNNLFTLLGINWNFGSSPLSIPK